MCIFLLFDHEFLSISFPTQYTSRKFNAHRGSLHKNPGALALAWGAFGFWGLKELT